jgi:hypothetical protein
MGLTIHYTLTTSLTKPQDVRKLVEAMRQHALDLPFKEVGEIKESKDMLAFSTQPGAGSEPANFGFRQQSTGWRWQSFCKTQYASDPRCGGIVNFLRCHISIVKLLDFVKATGLATVIVRDEGGYWEHRDMKKLAQEIVEWNELVAGLASEQRESAEAEGKSVQATITSFPNFEHLEAKGLERIAELRRNLGEQR